MSASSLTSPMLTALNVFSSSFTISATRGELTGTIVSTAVEYNSRASSEQVGVMPPITFGTLRVSPALSEADVAAAAAMPSSSRE